MKQLTPALFCLSFIVAACNNTVPHSDSNFLSSSDQKEEPKETNVQPVTEDVVTKNISNDISVATSGGPELDHTFLSYESDDKVPSTNITSVGKPVFLNLVLSKGWKEEMGEVAIGASQKISSDDGTVLIDNADMFDNYKSISAEDAKYIKLKALVTRTAPNIRYYIVDFKVWDKNGKGAITGSYRFFVQ